jgi:GDP-L-fucose synthase
MKVLVTGGTGLVGSAIKHFRPDWIYIGTKECDLRNYEETSKYFSDVKPTHVIHLAARVGGLFRNLREPVEMFQDSMNMNINVLKCSKEVGVQKVISILSTCIFPDQIEYPLTEEKVHDGPPHYSSEGYAYAKRMLECLSRYYNSNYTCVTPVNIYGPNDNYNPENSHVIPGIMYKMTRAGTDNLELKGTGDPLRQFMYSRDFARVLVELTILKDNLPQNLIVAPPCEDECSIKEIAGLIKEIANFSGEVIFENDLTNDGQYRKTASAAKFNALFPEFKFTDMKVALEHTYKDYIKNININRHKNVF